MDDLALIVEEAFQPFKVNKTKNVKVLTDAGIKLEIDTRQQNDEQERQHRANLLADLFPNAFTKSNIFDDKTEIIPDIFK